MAPAHLADVPDLVVDVSFALVVLRAGAVRAGRRPVPAVLEPHPIVLEEEVVVRVDADPEGEGGGLAGAPHPSVGRVGLRDIGLADRVEQLAAIVVVPLAVPEAAVDALVAAQVDGDGVLAVDAAVGLPRCEGDEV